MRNLPGSGNGHLADTPRNGDFARYVEDLVAQQAKALSGEAVASAAIIGSLPPVVATLISITAPDYMRPLFTDPRGHLMLMAGAFWMTIGVLSMRKMINFKM